jgi:hypothetical protein
MAAMKQSSAPDAVALKEIRIAILPKNNRDYTSKLPAGFLMRHWFFCLAVGAFVQEPTTIWSCFSKEKRRAASDSGARPHDRDRGIAAAADQNSRNRHFPLHWTSECLCLMCWIYPPRSTPADSARQQPENRGKGKKEK